MHHLALPSLTLYALTLATGLLVACDTSSGFDTDPLFSPQAVLWHCDVDCVESDGSLSRDRTVSCTVNRQTAEEDAEQSACNSNLDSRVLEVVSCTPTDATCTEELPPAPSPAW